jgi:Zn-finger nucleic acid-binding protein
VEACPSCHGAWFDPAKFKALEDETFHLDEHAKGTLVFRSTETDARCPSCEALLRRFEYRLYDLEIEMCTAGHGYWLDEGEDTRVLQLMKQEEAGIDRSFDAERRWAKLVDHLHSGSLIDQVRRLFL